MFYSVATMAKTPDRQNAAISRLKSPRTPSSPGTVAALRVEENVASFVDFHSKWKQAVDKGSQLCNAIWNIKNTAVESTVNDKPYPEKLSLYCKNLLIMTTIMEDVITNAGNVIIQLKSLAGYLHDPHVVGKTWDLQHLLNAMELALLSYRTELETRKYIAENIGHALTKDELTMLVVTWKHVEKVEIDREMRISMMAFEFNQSERLNER